MPGRKRKSRGKDADAVAADVAPVTEANDTNNGIDDSLDGSVLEPNEEANSLFASVKLKRTALQSVIDEWIESYRRDRDAATLELLQFFILASGCKGKITPQMKESMDYAKIIRELVQGFDEKAGAAYPIIMAGPSWKKFRSRFCELIHKLLHQCQFSIVFDQHLMECLMPFLIALADSQIRAFRHTAVLASLKMMTALVDIALTLSINIDNNLRQIQSEKGKGGKRSEKMEILESKRIELADEMEDLKNMLLYLFRSIVVHRYKDVVPEIRAFCISELGVWMKKFPNMFLNDSYLKYMGWSLYDKAGDARLKALQGLIPLYENEVLVKKLELFTDKFKERLVAMALDKEPEVAVQSIHLLTLIHKSLREILASQNCDQVYTLVYAVNRSVGQAAGDFVLARLILDQDPNETTTDQCSRRGKKRSKNTPYIRDLILFFMESELHEHCSYLVDSLIHHEMMKDWECMTDLLLEEPGPGEEPLDDQQETSLVDIMVSAVRQVVTGEIPVGRTSVKKSRAHAKEMKMLEEDKKIISNYFITVLPDLLKKYKADSVKIADLITIPCYFDLSCYSQKSDELEELLALINEIVEIHSDADVLEGCARAYEYLQDDTFVHNRLARISMGTLLDTLFEKYRVALEDCIKSGEGHEEMVTLIFIMKKIVPLVGCCLQLDIEDIWNLFFEKWVKNARKDDSEPNLCEATKCGLTICYYSLLWKLHSVSTSSSRERDLSSTKSKLIEFISSLTNLMDHGDKKVADEAYFAICDLFIIFGHHLANGSLALPELVCRPSKGQMDALIGYLSKNVFLGEEEDEEESEAEETLANSTVEKLHNKRHILAGYCKLIIFNIVPMHYASCVLRFYLEFFNDYGDLMKALINKMKDISRVNCAKTMAFALADGFKDSFSSKNDNESSSSLDDKTWLDRLKDLAKRFCLTFGLDFQKNRDVFVALHKEGINFALQDDDGKNPPPNLLFLEVLAEISNKLVKPDKKAVLAYLDKSLEANTVLKTGEQWSPLSLYRKTLSESILRTQNLPLNQTPSRRQSGQKRGIEQDAEDDFSDLNTSTKILNGTENDEPTYE